MSYSQNAARPGVWLASLTLLFSVALSGSLFSGCGESKAEPVAENPAMPVGLFHVGNQSYADGTELMAQVNSKHSTDIHPQVSSRIVRVLVTDGQQVRAGQPLYQLDISQQSAMVSSLNATRRASMEEPGLLQSTIQGQQADLAAARADLEFSRKQLGRYQSLLDDHTVSARDTEQYRTTVATQEQRVKSIQANIASQRSRRQEAVANVGRDTATLQSAQANLAYYTVRAPFTGVVGTLTAKEGDVVDPTTILTTLTDNRNLEIDVAVSADDRERIKMGMPMDLLSMKNEPLGEVRTFYIDPKVDPMTQTFLLKAKTTNSNQALAMDQHLKVRLIWGRKQAVLVPLNATFRLDGQPFVYRAENTTTKGQKGMIAHMQVVTLGDIVGDNVIITTGLKSGDTVIVDGIQKLQDGAAISQAPPESKVNAATSAGSQE